MRCVCLLFAFFLSACNPTFTKDSRAVNHVVMVWFNESVDDLYIHQVAVASQQLSRISGVMEISVGPPIESERSIVDDSFDLGLVIRFNSREEMMSYVDDPVHVKFVADYLQGKIQKLIVYDF